MGASPKSGGVGQADRAEGDAEPGEEGQTEVALEGQGAAGLLGHGLGDGFLVVVGVHKKDHCQDGDDDKRNHGADDDGQNLDERAHARASCTDMESNMLDLTRA